MTGPLGPERPCAWNGCVLVQGHQPHQPHQIFIPTSAVQFLGRLTWITRPARIRELPIEQQHAWLGRTLASIVFGDLEKTW